MFLFNFCPLFWRSFLSLYSHLNCIIAFHLYSHWPSFRCLSHQHFVGDGKMCCKLWEHCLGVIPPLMWSAELVHCIECGGDGYFICKFSFFFACTSLLSSSVFCLQCKWSARSNLRNTCSSSSSGSQPLHLSSSDSYPCVKSRLMCGWAPPPPQTGPTSSIPYSDLTLPQCQCSQANCKLFSA